MAFGWRHLHIVILVCTSVAFAPAGVSAQTLSPEFRRAALLIFSPGVKPANQAEMDQMLRFCDRHHASFEADMATKTDPSSRHTIASMEAGMFGRNFCLFHPKAVDYVTEAHVVMDAACRQIIGCQPSPHSSEAEDIAKARAEAEGRVRPGG